MALVNNLEYTNLDAAKWYYKMIFGAPLLKGTKDFPGPFFTVLENVKGTIELPILETTTGLQASGCTLTPDEDFSQDPRTITTCKIAASSKTCKEQFAKDNWINQSPFNQRPGAMNDGPSQTLLESYRDRKIALIARKVNLMMIQGDPEHGYDPELELCPGLKYRINDTVGDPEETARVHLVDANIISSGNVLTEFANTYESLDELLIDKVYNGEENVDVRWLVSPKTLQYLRKALADQNANYPALSLQQRNGVSRFYYNDIPVFSTEAVPDNEMFVYDKGNVYFATDLLGDLDAIKIVDLSEFSPSNDFIEFLAKFYFGMAIKEGNFITYYRTP